MTGSIDSGETDVWQFTALDGAMLSILAEATSGNLDPVISIHNQAGNTILSNDDFEYPDNLDAIIEGMTIPVTGTYTVSVSGYDNSSGDYDIALLSGYGTIHFREEFNNESNWQSSTDQLLFMNLNQRLNVELNTASENGILLSPAEATNNFYAEFEANSVTSNLSNWLTGMVFRYQDSGDRYEIWINSNGLWRMMKVQDGNLSIIQDWITHPAIVPGQVPFKLGVQATDSEFDIFYNGHYLNTVVDTSISEEGDIGLLIGSTSPQHTTTIMEFGQFLVTTELDKDDNHILPQQFIVDSSSAVIRTLKRLHVIPVDAVPSLTLAENSGNSQEVGVARLPIGRGVTYRNLLINTNVQWETTDGSIAGCGLTIRDLDSQNYVLAFVDQTGGYALAEKQENVFQPGLYGEIENVDNGNHNIVLIANEDTISYYLDGYLVGSIESTVQTGQVANAIINYDPVSTNCTFRDTWVLSWE